MPKIPSRRRQELLERQNGRKERLAINVYDLERADEPFLRRLELRKRLIDRPISMDEDKKEPDVKNVALEFSCDLLTAASICDVIRSHDQRSGDYPTRVYIFRKSAWSQLSQSAILVETVDDEMRLSRKVFPQEINVEDLIPPPVQRLF